MTARRDGGQATVELALVLPVVALVLLAILQFSVIGEAEVVTVHAAREGARSAAVGADDGAVRDVVLRHSGLAAARVTVTVARAADTVTVVVGYRQGTDVALVGPLIGDVDHVASATMRREDVE